MHSIRAAAIVSSVSALLTLVLACGPNASGTNTPTAGPASSAPYGEPPRAPPPPTIVNSIACGVVVFENAACENVVDGYCCREQIDCASDAVCDRFMRCRYACKHKGDSCLNACALELLQTHGADATKIGVGKFDKIATCSKRTFTALGDPPGARCDDDS